MDNGTTRLVVAFIGACTILGIVGVCLAMFTGKEVPPILGYVVSTGFGLLGGIVVPVHNGHSSNGSVQPPQR